MPRGITNKKNVSGAGTIRKKTVQRRGKAYTYWEARYTVGFDSGTGKQIQRSVTGKTQKEVSQELRQVATDIDQGTYIEPCKMTVREWMDTWAEIYLGGVKPRTAEIYKSDIRLYYIKPALGAIRLDALNTHTIQQFYNALMAGRDGKHGLSAKPSKISTAFSIRR